MVDDTVGLLDHLGIGAARLAGYSMGGWIAETMCARRPERVVAAALIGSCNVPTSWEKAITSVELSIAHSGVELPRLFYATETIRYLPNSELQDDAVVDAWLSMIGDMEVWPNPGREGQYAACMALSLDTERMKLWPDLSVPILVLGFEHDVDSPPDRARQAAAQIPGARFREIAGASHLGPMTHASAVAAELVSFFTE
jgi:pimeloyl-ACP methyl ester carboxylesterase